MTMRFTSAGVLAVAVLVAAAPEEGAASPVWHTSTITFSGQVTSGTDVTGVFGEAGADLSGLRYEMSYQLIGSFDLWGTLWETDGLREEYFTEELYGKIQPTRLRINDRAFSFLSGSYSIASATSGSNVYYSRGLRAGFYSENYEMMDPSINLWDLSWSYQSFSDPTDHQIRSLFTPVVLRANGPQTGGFNLKRVDYSEDSNGSVIPLQAFGTLNAQWMRITAGGIAPIPLPATVGPFLLALGLGGVISRRRKRRT